MFDGNTFISLQKVILTWSIQCLGNKFTYSRFKRNRAFLEESLELVQSLEFSKEDVLKVVDFVYNKPLGKPSQEAAGVALTLAALANTNKLQLNICVSDEIARIHIPEVMKKIKEKQRNKDIHFDGKSEVV